MTHQDGSHLLFTGATGLLGRYLLGDLLRLGIPLAIIARPSRSHSAEQRIDLQISAIEQEIGESLPRPLVLSGDLTTEQLGLSSAAVRWIAKNCDRVLHNAASLSFHSSTRDDEPWRTNVQGTERVLDLCQQAELRDFHHVSTAYVCGSRQGVVYENELDVGQQWSNCYEQSKVEGEHLVRDARFLDRLTVYRPSIIIGDSRTGFTSTFHGLYAVTKLAHTLARKLVLGSVTPEMALAALPLSDGGAKNFVPVDWVSQVMVRIIGNRELCGKTYHVTGRQAIPLGEWGRAVFDAVTQLSPLASPSDAWREDVNWFHQQFQEQMGYYRSYWRNDPHFDDSNLTAAVPGLPCPEVDYAMVHRMASFAVEADFGKRQRRESPRPLKQAGEEIAAPVV
jgi:thioester reductase-like protein